MYNIEEIRKIFSKAVVTVCPKDIAAVYVFKDRWFTQSIAGEEKELFCQILDDCESVVILPAVGHSIKFIFTGKFGFDLSEILPPIDSEVTREEMDAMLSDPANTVSFEAIQALRGVDLSNEEELFGALEEMMKSKRETVYFPTNRNLDSMLEEVRKLPSTPRFSLDVNNPDRDFPGCVTFSYNPIDASPVVLSGKALDSLVKLANMSSELAIEGDVNSGNYDITLFT